MDVEYGGDLAEQLDGLIDTTPTVVGEADLTAVPLEQLADDLARKIWDYPTIARRFGIDMAGLFKLCSIPAFARMVKAKRATWESDGSAVDRLRAYWAEGMIQAAPTTIAMLHDPDVPKSIKVELTKLGAKICGADLAPAKDANTVPQGAQFAVNITFSSAGQVERISTAGGAAPLLEGEAA